MITVMLGTTLLPPAQSHMASPPFRIGTFNWNHSEIHVTGLVPPATPEEESQIHIPSHPQSKRESRKTITRARISICHVQWVGGESSVQAQP